MGRFLAPFVTKKGAFQIQPITNTGVNSRKASKVSPSKLKTKIKIGRGYNPSIVPYKVRFYVQTDYLCKLYVVIFEKM